MKKFLWLGFVLFASQIITQAASSHPLTMNERTQAAKAIFRGAVLENISFRNPADNGIYTKTILRVDEPLKGIFPENIQVIHRGGKIGSKMETDSFSPRFTMGEERLLFLDSRTDGTLFAFDGEPSAILLHRTVQNGKTVSGDFNPEESALLASIRQQIPAPAAQGIDTRSQSAIATSGPSSQVVGDLLSDNGISSRFTAPDRGEKIPYLVDAQALPTGITLAQALTAVSNALQAWTAVSSVEFIFEGLQNFGQPAFNVPAEDGKIRIQLHDLFGFITGSTTLGQGGRGSTDGGVPAGGAGGRVAGREFHLSTHGYVTLKHTDSSMQTLSTFEEVLSHEIGHVLSLDHSSTNSSEANSTLREAMMYFTVHEDGRGATLGSYDIPKIRLVHPLNTPPYGYNRVMDIVTQPSGTPNVAGINEIELRGYDRQGTTLSVVITNALNNGGTFSLTATNILKFTPAGYIGAARIDPSDELSSYANVRARFSDGTNSSPFIFIRVISFMDDSQPANSDGLPDDWMTNYFGSVFPTAGAKTRANDDFDNDSHSNLTEFRLGTNPANSNSNLKITSVSATNLQFIASPYEVYEIETTQNFSSWLRATNPVMPTVANPVVSVNASGSPRFFRVLKVR